MKIKTIWAQFHYAVALKGTKLFSAFYTRVPSSFPTLEKLRNPTHRTQHAQCYHSQCENNLRILEQVNFMSLSLYTAHASAGSWC